MCVFDNLCLKYLYQSILGKMYYILLIEMSLWPVTLSKDCCLSIQTSHWLQHSILALRTQERTDLDYINLSVTVTLRIKKL